MFSSQMVSSTLCSCRIWSSLHALLWISASLSRGTEIPGDELSLNVSHTANMQSRVFKRFSSPSLWIFIYGVTNFGRNPEQASSHLN